jgi:hypothetical protein
VLITLSVDEYLNRGHVEATSSELATLLDFPEPPNYNLYLFHDYFLHLDRAFVRTELRVFTGKIPAALRYTTKLTRQHGLPYYSCPVPSRVSQVTKVSITSIDMS